MAVIYDPFLAATSATFLAAFAATFHARLRGHLHDRRRARLRVAALSVFSCPPPLVSTTRFNRSLRLQPSPSPSLLRHRLLA